MILILWGLAEATLFFVVPDVFFTRTTVVSVRRGWLQLCGAVAGALVGGCLMFGLADSRPAQLRSVVARVPFIGDPMIAEREDTWRTGATALFAKPLSGIPYKVDAVLAPAYISLPSFLMISVPLRLERMALSMIVFVPIGLWVGRAAGTDRRRRERLGFSLHAAFWVILYAYYWSTH